MSHITLHRRQWFKYDIPYWVFINQRPIGLMRTPQVNVQLPAGTYTLGVKMVFQLFKWRLDIGSEETVNVDEGETLNVRISDRERWWNILFDIDLVIWLASFLITLPQPWDSIYDILSEGFFILWMIRTWIIRKNYFHLQQQ